MNTANEKEQLRLKYKAILMKIPESLKNKYNQSLFSKVIDIGEFKTSKNILIYHPLSYEVNIFDNLTNIKDKNYFLPKIINQEIFPCKYISKSDLMISEYKILTPKAATTFQLKNIDLIIVPGLAFTLSGQRLGQGKGLFDKFLKKYYKENKQGKTLSVVYPEQLAENLPTTSHDQKIQKIITTNK